VKQYKVACALVFNPKGDILMVRQPPLGQQKEEYWIMPGGKMEAVDQECYLTAACREVLEETGLKVTKDMGKFIYRCEYENFGDNSSVLINMHIFHADGALLPADPDGDILEAKFIPRAEAIEKIKSLPWPAVRDPLLAYLSDPEQKKNLHWRYKAMSKDKHELIYVLPVDNGNQMPTSPNSPGG
jgi:8-oxo-dGTP diphosphatase